MGAYSRKYGIHFKIIKSIKLFYKLDDLAATTCKAVKHILYTFYQGSILLRISCNFGIFENASNNLTVQFSSICSSCTKGESLRGFFCPAAVN